MKRYHISHMDKKTKEKNIELYKTIEEKGRYKNGGWNGDYYVTVYHYQGKRWELWDNMELGIMSEVDEMKVSEEHLQLMPMEELRELVYELGIDEAYDENLDRQDLIDLYLDWA